MRSLMLDRNEISDDGLTRLAEALKKNNKLAHISFKGCSMITDEGLQMLLDVISSENTVLFNIQFDNEAFDPDLASKVIQESSLNRAIQEQLKPIIFRKSNTDVILSPVSNRTMKDLKLSKAHLPKNKVDKEVVFAEGAPVSLYFESALKCWRINSPSII